MAARAVFRHRPGHHLHTRRPWLPTNPPAAPPATSAPIPHPATRVAALVGSEVFRPRFTPPPRRLWRPSKAPAAGTIYGTPAAATRDVDSPFRTESFRFELLDAEHNSVGEVHPIIGGEIACVSGAPIGRSIPSLLLGPDEATSVDADNHRIRVWVVVNGTSYSLGVFIPSTPTRHVKRLGTWLELQLYDLGVLLTATTTNSYGVTSGTTIVDHLKDLADLAGIVSPTIVDADATAGNHLAWPKGTTYFDIMVALAKRVGLTAPWFDRDGAMHISFLPYAGLDSPRRTFHQTIGTEGIQETDDRFTIPVAWEVRSATATADLSAVYELPDEHPLSAANRRNVPARIRTVEIPGLSTTGECLQRARDEAQRDARVHRAAEFSAQPDPTLELNDVVTYATSDWLLESWRYPLAVGGSMPVRVRESLIEDSSL